jgi:phage tail-like protein
MAPRASSFDPYRAFKFRVRLDGAVVVGLTRVGALSRSLQSNEVKEAGDLFGARWMPGAVSFDEVSLEQGWSADDTFERWANEVLKLLASPASAKQFKRTVFIDVFDLAGTPATLSGVALTSYKLHRAWVSKYVAMPELDAAQGGIGIRSVSLRHEGWERV